jgi:hypothetical protein
VWRAFVFLSLIAFGLCLFLVEIGHAGFAAAWAVIGTGWLATGLALWRKHIKDDDAAYAAGWRRGRKVR